MLSIALFNNKGGVGKTTLLCNVASYIATELHKSVLVVDTDPQCNATQLILGESKSQELYESQNNNADSTIYDILEPIALGESSISESTRAKAASSNNFHVSLVPGDPRLSLLEDKLSQSWLDFNSGDIGGARRTNWTTQLLKSVNGRYDIVFFDLGPSLAALNRSVLVGVDYFITPMTCDIFSLMGISNISTWLDQWIELYDSSLKQANKLFPGKISQYPIKKDTNTICRFIGYTVQQYITKSKKGVRRPTLAYEDIRARIPNIIESNLRIYTASHLANQSLELPDVPHMYSLVPLAQASAMPIHRLGESNSRIVGSQYQQKQAYVSFIKNLSNSICTNAGLEI